MANPFETIVIGLGAMGSAAAYQLARRGNRVLGLDQFSPPHTHGSSHGETRITRQAIGEGPAYVPLALRSYEIWREIERETGQAILTVTGGLIMTSVDDALRHGSNFFNQTVACAEKYGISHRLLDADEIRKRWPQFRLRGDERGYFEEQAGYLRPETAVGAQLALARRHGAVLGFGEKVTSLAVKGDDQVVVTTDQGEYRAARVILSPGPWITGLLGESLARYFTIYRQVLYWFDIEGEVSAFEAPGFPVWIWELGTAADELIYGFPAIGGARGGLKIASEQYAVPTHPDRASREVSAAEKGVFFERYVRPHLQGITAHCVKAVSCLYTVTPDHAFVIDHHPDLPQILVASPCSGHGFKHSAAIGEALAQLVVDGRSEIDISAFSFRRFEESART